VDIAGAKDDGGGGNNWSYKTTKSPLRKPNRGERIVSRKPRPKSVHDFLSSQSLGKY